MTLYKQTKQQLDAVLQTLNVPAELLANVVLETPRDASFGDFATNAAMMLCKPLGKKPMELAEEIAAGLRAKDGVADVTVAAPGFINIKFETSRLLDEAMDISRLGAAFGKSDLYAGRKAMVEYVSINPTGPIHVGHGRNAVFGDAIANMLEKAGFEVWREYLVNDAGGQIRVLVRSLHARYLQQLGHDVDVPTDGYPGEYLVDIAKKLVEKDGNRWENVTDEDVLLKELRVFAVDSCMAMIKADIETMGITFDRYFSEYAMHQTSAMNDAVAMLRDMGLVYEGCLPPPKGKTIENYQPVELTLFKATAFGLNEDQAIFKRNGEATYFGQDIAYHFDKLKRGYDFLVTVLGADQSGSYKPLEKAVEAMTGKKGVYNPVPYEMVKVERDGQPVKLSKRAGNIVLLSDVLAEVGKDAFRFMMLTVKPTTPLVFDVAKSVEKSMDNPVFYVQYAHARLASVWRQEGVKELDFGSAANTDVSDEARAVLVTLMRYPLVVEQAARSIEPHRLAFYAQELAAAVHKWYAAERWLNPAEKELSVTRLNIAKAAQAVLKDVLGLCGVSAPDSM